MLLDNDITLECCVANENVLVIQAQEPNSATPLDHFDNPHLMFPLHFPYSVIRYMTVLHGNGTIITSLEQRLRVATSSISTIRDEMYAAELLIYAWLCFNLCYLLCFTSQSFFVICVSLRSETTLSQCRGLRSGRLSLPSQVVPPAMPWEPCCLQRHG